MAGLASEAWPLARLRAARAAYLWRLQSEWDVADSGLADLQVAFRWLLQLQAGEVTAELLRARTCYVAELHAARLGPDDEIADLAAVHQDLITEALVQAAGRELAHPESRCAPGSSALPRGVNRGISRRRS
ncbi:MAG: hypothetical protein ACR2NJ_08310 [Acidimicrobiales bacterium]